MADLVNASAQAIADALAPSPQAPAARWRWGSVVSVNAGGTMNVSIGGATVPSIRCAQHVMGAQVGDRVRVLYCGTECMVDAVRASSSLMTLPTIADFSQANGTVTLDSTSRSAWLSALAPDVLYSDATGTNGTVALSASAANFQHMTIYYKQDVQDGGWDYGGCSSVDVYAPNGKHVEIGMTRYTGDATWVYQTTRATLLVSGAQIIVQNAGYINQRSGGTPTLAYGTNNLYVYRVEGW